MAAGAGVHVNKSERLVPHDFEDVGMAADEQARPQPTDFLACPAIVIAGIAADVGHVYADAFAFPNKIFGQFGTDFRTIDVAVDSPRGFEGFQAIEHLGRPEVSGMPDLIALGEVVEDRIIQKPVCVGEQPDPQPSS